MGKIAYTNYVINRMEARGITETQIEDALRNISKQEEKGGRTCILSSIINRDLMLIIKGGYRKSAIITALWRREK